MRMNLMRRAGILAALAVLAAAAILLAARGPAEAQGSAVAIQGFAFSPATLTVPVGTTVTWTNRDAAPHTVTATDASFGSPTLETGQSFSFTPARAGTFGYMCTIHPGMKGTLIVTAAAAPAATVTPNGAWTGGANQAVVQGGGTAAQIAAAATADSGRTVAAVWYLAGGTWTYYLPAFPSINGGLSSVPGPVASVFIVLA